MKKLTTLLTFLVFLPLLLGQQYRGIQKQSFTVSGSGTSIKNIGSGISFHTLQWTVSGGTLSACTIQVDSSTDNVSFSAGGVITGQTCTSNSPSPSPSASATVNYTRITTSVTVATGSPTVTAIWTGYAANPNGGPGSTSNTQFLYNNNGAIGGATQWLYDTTDSPGFPTLRGGIAPSGANQSNWNFFSDQAVLQVNTQVDSNLTRPFGIFGGVDNPQSSESAAYGIFGYCQTNAGSGAGCTAFNADTEVYSTGSAGTNRGDIAGFYSNFNNRGSGTVPFVIGHYAGPPVNGSTGAITTAEGFYADVQTAGGAANGIGFHAADQGANNYAFKAEGAGQSEFSKTTIHDPSDTTKKFVFDGSGISTGNTRTVHIPDAASSPVQDCPSVANQFVISISQSTGGCTKAQPTPTNVGLGSVTNDVQTKAAVMPNTAPGAGQIPVGNAGATAYAPSTLSQDCALASTGAITCTKTNNVSFATSATTDTTNAANISSGHLAAGRLPTNMALTLKKGSGAGNYTSASTTYAVIDSTNLCFTVTIPSGWALAIHASGNAGTATAVVAANIAITDNAACSTANSGILTETQIFGNAAGNTESWALNWMITGDGASHNVALQFKTANGADSVTVINSSSTFLPQVVFWLTPQN